MEMFAYHHRPAIMTGIIEQYPEFVHILRRAGISDHRNLGFGRIVLDDSRFETIEDLLDFRELKDAKQAEDST